MREFSSSAQRRPGVRLICRSAWLLFAVASLCGPPLLATSVIPISDAELHQRADVIVYGIVISSDVTADGQGRPETITVIRPTAVLKGRLAGSLVLHQLGGTLPDGRFFKLWGRPEYIPGREVVVFAIARPEGEYQTAELMLGKFEVWQDETGKLFAVPDLAAGVRSGVEILERPTVERPEGEEGLAGAADERGLAGTAARDPKSPRELGSFLSSLRAAVFTAAASAAPSGRFEPVQHPQPKSGGVSLEWGNIADSMFRWNGATATWTISGTANMDGGGLAEAQGALATWTDDPNSNINYTAGSGSSNMLYLNNTVSMLGCGWTTCLTGGGVIGCGGPTGVGGSNTWRGETYTNINQAVAELRSSCVHNGFGSVITQSVLTHELGHTLGLGHSDQNVSPHDICRGDEDAATMRSVVQSRTTLGTDDQDAIRWLYGDGGTSCSGTTGSGVRGDFNGDGKPDILWRNTSGGVYVWLMNGTTVVSGASLPSTDPSWSIAGTGDFNGDGKTDILWRHTSGAVYVWLMNGTTVVSGVSLPAADPSWSIAATGDFNGDGKTDILWHHTSGAVLLWLMNGTTVSSGVSLPSADTRWSIAGTADFNGDGKTDILWRHTSGAVYVWLMNGTTVSSGVSLPSADTSWSIAGTADFNGDGKSDILWRHISGFVYVWLMNGTTVVSGTSLPFADPSWVIVGPK